MKNNIISFCCGLILVMSFGVAISENANADIYHSAGSCESACKIVNGKCEPTTVSVDGETITAYNCVTSASNQSSFPIDNGAGTPAKTTTKPSASSYPTATPSNNTSTYAGASGECGNEFTKVSGVCIPNNTGLSGASVDQIVKNFLFWLLAIFATIATIAFIISGIQYLLASGSEEMMETAKRNMIYSIIGILVGLSGLVILRAIEALLSARTLI